MPNSTAGKEQHGAACRIGADFDMQDNMLAGTYFAHREIYR